MDWDYRKRAELHSEHRAPGYLRLDIASQWLHRHDLNVICLPLVTTFLDSKNHNFQLSLISKLEPKNTKTNRQRQRSSMKEKIRKEKKKFFSTLVPQETKKLVYASKFRWNFILFL